MVGRRPLERHLRGGEGRERGCHHAVASDEPPVEVGKPQETLKLRESGTDQVVTAETLAESLSMVPPPYDVPQEGDRRGTRTSQP